MDSKDGRDLKLKKLGQLFQVLMVRLQKLLNKLSLFVPGPDEIFLIYFFITLKRVFMYFLPPPFGTTFLLHHIMSLVQEYSNFLKLIFFRRNLFSSDLGTVNAKNSSDTFMTK